MPEIEPAVTPAAPQAAPVAPNAETAVTRAEPSLSELQAILDELGLEPGQLKGRLEASKKNEARAKENAEKAQRLDALEEASRTELEKAQARADAAEKAAKDALEAKLRSDIARTKGVPVELLTGSTEEEITAAAEALLAFKGTAPAAPSAAPQGAVGTQITGTDPDLDAAIAAAEKARNFPLAITLKQQKAAKKG